VPDLARCTRCLVCVACCPDGVSALDDLGYPVIDLDHCKSCLICEQVSPLHGIAEEKEARS
jgi:Pyruvate/2-oxoacid:ferredoxin oxidoreductase delta subunit